MDETLTSVNAEQESVECSQEIIETSGTTEVVTGESESAVTAEQPTTEKAEPKKQTQEENAAFKALRLEERQRVEQAAAKAARDAVYANLAKENNWVSVDGKPITTEADYVSALEMNRKMAELINQGESEETATLKIKLEQLERERSERDSATQKAAKDAAEREDFFKYFEQLNGKPWTPADVIPDEVWAANVNDGVPLKYAYSDHFARQQIEKNKSIEIGKKTAEANAANATTTTGSLTGNGSASNDVLTEDSIASMSSKELMSRWGEVKTLLKMK